MLRRVLVLLIFCVLAGPRTAASDPIGLDQVCPDDDPEVSLTRHLRELSLDLRGTVPTVEEYEDAIAQGEVPESLIDEWLASQEFVDRTVRRHRALLWNNVTNIDLFNNSVVLSGNGNNTPYWRRNPAVFSRGERVPCLDEPAQWDDEGRIVTTLQDDGTRLEGWVDVAPYWAPETTVRVCAFDAQETQVSASGTQCATSDGFGDPGCGCGPNLAWCRGNAMTVRPLMEAMGRDVELRIADILAEDGSYLDLFTGRVAYVNGPLTHFWKHQLNVPAGIRMTPSPIPVEQLPDLEFTDVDTWVPIQLGQEHAGILTSPAYLLRFQTRRSRANRFFTAFMCQPFQPPDSGLEASDDESSYSLDLQQRDGCKYCHALLEPSAAYWGRWPETGAGYLNPEEFPGLREDCHRCATSSLSCSDACNTYYLTSTLTPEQTPYLGMLQAFEFRREDHVPNIEAGPKALALSVAVDGRLPECVSRTAVSWLLGRDVLPEEEPWIDELNRLFVASDFSYRTLIKRIVESPVYRTVQ
ncbi:MAG TPA: hypothetical protein DIU15_12655 [Deltaproteobacteria bacterium]|nr:hypothetical protein [Deltaproteobacteria bacterium]HCP46888.1 hypothetical protein [Deltaproteobacteria bacterium]